MDKKSWSDAVKPAGSILPNWHIILGIVFSLIAGVGLIMTSDEPVIPTQSDPFDLEIEIDDPELVEGQRLRRLTTGIEATADERARQLAEARQRANQEALRQQRAERIAAQDRERAYREALETLEALRNRPNQPGLDRDLSDNMADTSDEASMLQALRLEDLQRQHNAFRAPMVASSARGIGERAHALNRPEITQTFERPPSPVRPEGAIPPGRRPPATGRAQATPPPVRSRPAAPSRPGVAPQSSAGPLIQGPGAPGVLVDDTPPAAAPLEGEFVLGPRSDGGSDGSPAGVVVTPVDGPGNYRLYEGKLFPAVLQTQINGSYSGPIKAHVTRHVYSNDRQRVLVPRGTVALGQAGSVADTFQGRLAVSFHRLIFPDGSWLRLNFAGLNNLGETSLKDQVNRHYLSTFGTAGAIGVLAGLATSSGGGGGQGQFRSAMSEQMASVALTLLQRFLNRQPDITIRAGHPLNIYLTSDVVFPEYATWQAD